MNRITAADWQNKKGFDWESEKNGRGGFEHSNRFGRKQCVFEAFNSAEKIRFRPKWV